MERSQRLSLLGYDRPYRPLREKGETHYILYTKLHRYRGNERHPRTYVKGVYIGGKNPKWSLINKKRRNKQGHLVRGIAVTYTNVVSGTMVKRGSATYPLPAREMKVTKIIPIPKDAKNIRVIPGPPAGSYVRTT